MKSPTTVITLQKLGIRLDPNFKVEISYPSAFADLSSITSYPLSYRTNINTIAGWVMQVLGEI
jgi:hypothetical protein